MVSSLLRPGVLVQDSPELAVSMSIATVIRAIVKNWDMPPVEINNGQCDQFASEVIRRVGGYSDHLTDNASNLDESGYFWVVYRDRCYDSECPNSVKDYHNLPFFRRAA